MKRYRVSLPPGFIKFLLIILQISLITVNCSHKSPFYRTERISSPGTSVSDDSLQQRLIFIGDAGKAVPGDPVMESLTLWSARVPQKTLVVFLGDNIYENGLVPENDPERKNSEKYLNAQIGAVKNSGAQGLFIPGNHDWAKGGEAGKAAILRQQNMVREMLPQDSVFLPADGCPGPLAMDLPGVRLIVMDTDIWINDKIEWSENCEIDNEQAFLQKLDDLLQSSAGRPVVIAAHHPLQSHGTHSGFYDWQDHIFPLTREIRWLWLPLPVVGSLYPLSRTHIVKSDQDFVGENYRHMLESFRSILEKHRPLAYFAGHDHNLQVLEGELVGYMLVSGAGSIPKIMPVGDGEDTLFAHAHTGFMVLDIYENGKFILYVIEPPDGKIMYSKILKK